MSFSPALSLYRAGAFALGPLVDLWLDARVRSGKEDGERLQERYGYASRPRPAGKLVWLHAASVGESGVALQIAAAMEARDPSLSFLITTGTRTSAELVAKRASARTRHIYAPVDRPDAVKRFLSHWRPDLGIFVESEVWPNLILEAQSMRIPLALVNARMSPETLARWQSWPQAAKRVFGAFAVALAADNRTADALAAMRNEPAQALGNLKLTAPAPRFDTLMRSLLTAHLRERKLWLAASTHEGEEEILLSAHAELRQHYPDALLIIAPRHPDRGAAIAALAQNAPRRSLEQTFDDAPVYVADTLGELGLFYSVAHAAFIAGSLKPQLKGHNPIEPVKLDTPVIAGPYVESFQDVYDALTNAQAISRAGDVENIVAAVLELWADPFLRKARAIAANAVIAQGDEALGATIAKLFALLPASNEAGETKTANASA